MLSLGQFDPGNYTPAVLRLSFSLAKAEQGAAANPAVKTESSQPSTAILDVTLITPQGDLVGKRVDLARPAFVAALRNLYAQLARQAPMDLGDPQAPARQLFDVLIRPVLPEMQAAKVTTLLIAADPGLQGVPYAALHDGQDYLGSRYALALTPTLSLTPLESPRTQVGSQQLLAGSSRFDGLAPLPLVPQELDQISKLEPSKTYLDQSFTPQVLLTTASEPGVTEVHVASHAEFLPGGPQKARLYTGTTPMSLAQFAGMRQRRQEAPLDLFSLSACRTALGDNDSELGFAGLALQAGSRSAIGTLWYVDDVATSAFFVLFHRYRQAGWPKADALQATRRAFASGAVRLDGDRVIGPDGGALLQGLSGVQRSRLQNGLSHPYYWAGIQMMGVPW